MYDFEQFDYYELLGVARGASLDEIKRAYRQQIARYHPDRFATAPEDERQYASQRAQRINEAYRVLSDFGDRSAYNRNQPIPSGRRAAGVTPPPPPQPRDHLAELYEQAQAHLTAGRFLQAAATLRQIQQLNPFYRDSAALLARAEAAGAGAKATPRPRPAAGHGGAPSRSRRGLILGGLGGLALAALAGASVWFRQAQSAAPGAASAPAATVAPGSPPAATAAPLPTAAPPTRTLPAVAQVPTALPPSAAPTRSFPATAAPPSAPTARTSPSATAAPTASPRPAAASSTAGGAAQDLEQGELLYADDFLGQQRWATLQGRTWSVGYADTGYQIVVQQGAGNIWSFNTAPGGPDLSFGVEVRVDGGAAGLLLRYVDRGNYLVFLVDPQAGTFELERHSGGRAVTLADGAILAVKTGADARNRLVAELENSQMRLFVNGVPAAEVALDGVGQSPLYGLVAAPRTGDTTATFTRLEVRSLSN